MPDLQRRKVATWGVLALSLALSPWGALADPTGFEAKAFRAAQANGKPVLVDVYANW